MNHWHRTALQLTGCSSSRSGELSRLQTPDLQNPESRISNTPGLRVSTLLGIRSSVLPSNQMRASGQVKPTSRLLEITVSDCFQPSCCDDPTTVNLPLFFSLTSWLRSHRPCWSACLVHGRGFGRQFEPITTHILTKCEGRVTEPCSPAIAQT